MNHAQAVLAGWAAALAALALFAGWRERRRRLRTRFDQVGLLPWTTIQVLALIGLALVGFLALRV